MTQISSKMPHWNTTYPQNNCKWHLLICHIKCCNNLPMTFCKNRAMKSAGVGKTKSGLSILALNTCHMA